MQYSQHILHLLSFTPSPYYLLGFWTSVGVLLDKVLLFDFYCSEAWVIVLRDRKKLLNTCSKDHTHLYISGTKRSIRKKNATE